MNKINGEELEHAFVSLVVEAWRFSRVFRDTLPKLNDEDSARCQGRYSWFCRRLEEICGDMGVRIVEIAPGIEYDPGMAVTPLNISEFEACDSLHVEHILEPVIMRGDTVISTGTVILGRREKECTM